MTTASVLPPLYVKLHTRRTGVIHQQFISLKFVIKITNNFAAQNGIIVVTAPESIPSSIPKPPAEPPALLIAQLSDGALEFNEEELAAIEESDFEG